jgi:metalloendopeptidase OMA1, mitochondrial
MMPPILTDVRRGWSWRTVVVCAVALALVGCDLGGPPDIATRPGEGPGRRHQELALSPAEELAVGRRAYREVLTEYRARLLPDGHPEVERCRRIVRRLADAAKIEPLQREINLKVRGYTFDWEINVVRERQVNAFCLPAGKMIVFSGLLPVAGNDAQLAAVISHEMAHALAHHGSERVARERSGGNILGSLKYDRFQESEADKIGIFLMAFADYDPTEAVTFWQRMSRVTGDRGGLPEILSDHPSHGTRVQELRKWAPRAKAARKAFDEGRIAPPGR